MIELVVAPLLHKYIVPPVAINVSEVPVHIGDFPFILAKPEPPEVTVIVLVTVSPPPHAVTINCAV